MGAINLESLKPGMILAADLRSPQGRLLSPKGSALSEKELKLCKIWGISEADVQGVSEEEAEAESLDRISPSVLKACKALALSRFRRESFGHPMMRELGRQFVMRTARGMSEKEAGRILRKLEENQEEETLAPSSLEPLCLDEVLKQELALSSLPDIFNQIVEALKSPKSSAAYVADVISKDISLSVKLLKLVNTPFYGFPQKIDTLSRAVTIVGTNQLTNLAMGISVVTMFEGIPCDCIDMKSFWRHSVACGVIGRLLAARLRGFNEERFFVAGLLHDIGRLVMLKNYPDHARELFCRNNEDKRPLYILEKERWGFDHSGLAAGLFKEWRLPASLEEWVRFHHAPSSARSKAEAAVVHAADVIAHGLEIGSSGDRYVPPLDTEAWKSLGFPKSILGPVVIQADHQIDGIMRVFFEGDVCER